MRARMKKARQYRSSKWTHKSEAKLIDMQTAQRQAENICLIIDERVKKQNEG